MSTGTEPLAALAAFERIPSRPAPALDRMLDATERCVVRYGLRRTSMTDIAKEMGVARTTLYRQVSSIEDAIALLASRQLFSFLDELTALLGEGAGPQAFIDAVVHTVTFGRSSPLASRVLQDEPELIGGLVTSGQLSRYLDQAVDLVVPIFEAAMAAGSIRAGDARLLTAFVSRLIGMLMLAPVGDDLERMVELALEPLLRP